MEERKISLDGIQPLIFYGSNNENMKLIKKYFPSLKVVERGHEIKITGDIEAIQKGLEGYTGRIGENRGNGLKWVQRWTIKDLCGILIIRSGSGLIRVDKDGSKAQDVNRILGTTAQFVIYYS